MATKPLTGMVSARRVGSTSAAAASRAGSTASDFRLCRSIFRRWPKAAAATCSSARRSHGSGASAGHQPHHRRGDFGLRDKRRRRNVEQDLCFGAPVRKHAEPAIGFVVFAGDDALGHLALKHQHHHVVPGRPRLDRQPVDQQRGRDVVGQVGDDFGAWRRRATGADRNAARRRRRSPADRDIASKFLPAPASARSSRSMAMTRRAPSASSARVRPPGPGPTSMTVASSSGPAARAIRAVRLRSSRKFCPSDFRADNACSRMTSRSGGRSSIALMPVCVAAIRAASRKAAIRLDGLARPVPAMSKAVP